MTTEAIPAEGAAALASTVQPIPTAPVALVAPLPVAPVAVAPAEPPKPHVAASSLPDDALKARLEHAKSTGQTELLKSLGVTSVEDLKAAIAAQQAAEEAKRSDAEKLTRAQAELSALKATVLEQEQTNAQIWANESAKLTPEQLDSIVRLAGDNATSRIRVLNTLRATWTPQASAAPVAQTSPVTPPAVSPVAAPAAAPATTSPAPAAPSPAGTTTPTDFTAVWKSLKQSNPIGAAQYLLQHQADISTQ